MSEYEYRSVEPSHTSSYLVGPVLSTLGSHRTPGMSVLDAGCGNGWFARLLADAGYEVSAIDSFASGVGLGSGSEERVRFAVGSVYDDFRSAFGGRFDAIVSLEVIEHLYDPQLFVQRVREALAPGGVFIVSTPYHGYIKNLALALSGRLDAHFTSLWRGGHIKFWSRQTLTALLESAGFEVLDFRGAGRLPLFWKSMILVARSRV